MNDMPAYARTEEESIRIPRAWPPSSCTRRRFLETGITLAAGALLPGSLRAAGDAASDFRFEPDKDTIPAPADPAQWPAFREQLARWRADTRHRLNYSDSLYQRADFAWAPSCFSCCFAMVNDEKFYDHRRGRYLVKDFLDHGREQFGGHDAVVLWHAYPRIGVDARNQFDFYRDLPGGLAGLRGLVSDFHRRGVKVFVDYNPWDTGTRREKSSDLDVLASLVGEIEADGIFLDTMSKGAAEFRAKLDAARPGVVLEGEGALPIENIHDHHMSWAQWFRDSEVPGILRNKWLERRHIQHQIKRWDYDHTGELHAAWMNGSGMMVWENVFGSWMGWSARDRSILRMMLPIQRRYSALFSGEGWTPLVPAEQRDVFASTWEGGGMRLWTLVNRSGRAVEGDLLAVPHTVDNHYYDLILGRELSPRIAGKEARLSGAIPPRGIGCFLSVPKSALPRDHTAFLARQAKSYSRYDGNTDFPRLETRLVRPPSGKRLDRVPEGMVEIPAATLELVIEMRNRECGFYESTPPAGHRLGDSYRITFETFRRQAILPRFAIDETPVTNAQFARFLKASGYRPAHPTNFLKHWVNGLPPSGKEDHPVVYVDLDDARAYAKWAGKRLPTEEEWQYAAQGPKALKYPWGDRLEPNRCNAGEGGDTTPVKAFPLGRSPFGCYDLCGNTWEWTESERTDGRTRFCIIRGGSYFSARGSNWYVDGGPQPANRATKFLLMWPGLDRCATVGFRCAADLA